jgi:hypothetical protein
MKSKIVKMIAAKLGIPLIDIKLPNVAPAPIPDFMVIDEINPRDIKVGDMVLMEYAKGVVETVLVEEIVDGIVYATGDDGEDFCAPVGNCDKVPF